MRHYHILAHYGDVEMQFEDLNGYNVTFFGERDMLRFYLNLTVHRWYGVKFKSIEPIRNLAKVGGICYMEIYRSSINENRISLANDNTENPHDSWDRIWEGDIAYDPNNEHEIEQIWGATPRLQVIQ